MIRKLVVSLICSVLCFDAFAQQAAQARERKAVEMLDYASQIAATAVDDIWPGFDARNYDK